MGELIMLRKALLAFALGIAVGIPCAVQAQPIGQSIAGWDYANSKSKVPFVDSTGAVHVTGAAAGGSIFGTDANNVAPSVAPVNVACVSAAQANAAGRVTYLQCDTTGKLQITVANASIPVTQSGSWTDTVTQATAANLNAQVVGNVAAGTADSGNGVKISGVMNTALPTYTAGQRGDLQVNAGGYLRVTVGGIGTNGTDAKTNTGVSFYSDAGVASGGLLFDAGSTFNGSTWDRQRSVQDGTGVPAGTGVQAIHIGPNSAAPSGIVPVLSAALESGHVLKASAGNLYRLRATVNISGYLLVFNATTVPADGAVTPFSCTQVPAGTTDLDYEGVPGRLGTGISVAFSTTGCFTKTASVNAMFEGYVE